MDYVFANDLEFDGDILTGKISGKIVNAETKEKIITDLAAKENLSLDQIVAIGDGAMIFRCCLKQDLESLFMPKKKFRKLPNTG